MAGEDRRDQASPDAQSVRDASKTRLAEPERRNGVAVEGRVLPAEVPSGGRPGREASSDAKSKEKASKKSFTAQSTVGFTLVALLIAGTLLVTPLALYSMVSDLFERDLSYKVTPEAAPGVSHAFLRINVESIDEVHETANIHVYGQFICGDCQFDDEVVLYSIPGGLTGTRDEGVPPSVAIRLPATSDTVSQMVRLPVAGTLTRYPFDRHPLWLGVALNRVTQGTGTVASTTTRLSGDEARKHLVLEVKNETPRMEMGDPHLLDPRSAAVQPLTRTVEYAYVVSMDFSRPLYVMVLVPLVILLMGAVSAYGFLSRPFKEIILGSSALVLGTWGVRSLLLGGFPPNTTFVDVTLTVMIILNLFGIGFRAMNLLHAEAGLRLLPWAIRESKPPTRECPECLSKVPEAAQRCAFCAQPLPALKPPTDAPVEGSIVQPPPDGDAPVHIQTKPPNASLLPQRDAVPPAR